MISWVAMDRIVEDKMASDEEYRELVAGRPIRSQARYFRDGELIAGLRSFGIEVDRPLLERLCRTCLSAEEMARPLIKKLVFKSVKEEAQGDWVWVYLDALWRRWFPEIPSFEMLDDKIQEGYELAESDFVTAACRVWSECWNDVLYFFDKADFHSIREFDASFQGTQCLFNWVQDLTRHLWNAGLGDRRFLSTRIAVCEAALRICEGDDDFLTGNFRSVRENFRSAAAESYFELNQSAKAETLYREWLNADPQWGWGWIGWSDCRRFTRTESRNWQRAEELLREGLSIAGVRNAEVIAERLTTLREEQQPRDGGANQRLRPVKGASEIKLQKDLPSGLGVLQFKTGGPLGEDSSPLGEGSKPASLSRSSQAPVAGTRHKVGRNDPCPCGSGKKFKKCCGE